MNKTPHPLAAMIKEWIEDTSRVVQVQLEDFGWMDQPNPNFDPEFAWRFADNVKPEVTSSLSDDEIDALWWSLKPVGNEMPSHHDIGRTIANAAAQEIVTRVMGLDAVTGMSFDDLFYLGSDRRSTASAAIKHFLANLPSALEKTK